MSSTIAFVGALAGLAVWGAAGAVAARSCYESATSEEQREVLRQLFRIGAPYAALLMGLVVLAGLHDLPSWVFITASACWFGALLPALAWAHKRLEADDSHIAAV